MGKYPVSTACPCCGNTGFSPVTPRTFLSFAVDRLCTACGSAYTPPTSRWASFFVVLIGLTMLLEPAYLICADPRLSTQWPLAAWGTLSYTFGLICVIGGVETLFQRRVPVPVITESSATEQSLEAQATLPTDTPTDSPAIIAAVPLLAEPVFSTTPLLATIEPTQTSHTEIEPAQFVATINTAETPATSITIEEPATPELVTVKTSAASIPAAEPLPAAPATLASLAAIRVEFGMSSFEFHPDKPVPPSPEPQDIPQEVRELAEINVSATEASASVPDPLPLPAPEPAPRPVVLETSSALPSLASLTVHAPPVDQPKIADKTPAEPPSQAPPEPAAIAPPVRPLYTSPVTTAPAILPPRPAPAKSDYNLTGLDYRDPMPWPKVRGSVIDFHCHLLAARHASEWFEAAWHYGIDVFFTMTPLEEVMGLQRDWPGKLHFIAVPQWYYEGSDFIGDWCRRIEAFYNLGSRIVKFHMAPQTIVRRGWRLDSPALEPVFREIESRGMMIMSHVGDPELWYTGRYADTAKYGTRDEHCRMWETVLERCRNTPWIGAHMAGNPENLPRLQSLLDRFPNLMLDCSATRWMAREISSQRDEARDFFIRNTDRILFGSDQVSGDDRNFDFLASRWWTHRKLWETAFIGPCPIADPDLPNHTGPELKGLALPNETLQKLYHDNAVNLMAKVGVTIEESPRQSIETEQLAVVE